MEHRESSRSRAPQQRERKHHRAGRHSAPKMPVDRATLPHMADHFQSAPRRVLAEQGCVISLVRWFREHGRDLATDAPTHASDSELPLHLCQLEKSTALLTDFRHDVFGSAWPKLE